MAAITNLTIINAAATRGGNDPITSLDQGGAVADIANQNYEGLVLAELSAYRWKWASKFEAASPLDEGNPPAQWLYAYQIPADCLELRSIRVGGEPIPYEVMATKFFCNFGADAGVFVHYLWRPPESQWPSWFREPVTRRMEAAFLRGIGERITEAEQRDAAADGTSGRWRGASGTFMRAQKLDAQSDSARNPYRYRILEARRA